MRELQRIQKAEAAALSPDSQRDEVPPAHLALRQRVLRMARAPDTARARRADAFREMRDRGGCRALLDAQIHGLQTFHQNPRIEGLAPGRCGGETARERP